MRRFVGNFRVTAWTSFADLAVKIASAWGPKSRNFAMEYASACVPDEKVAFEFGRQISHRKSLLAGSRLLVILLRKVSLSMSGVVVCLKSVFVEPGMLAVQDMLLIYRGAG